MAKCNRLLTRFSESKFTGPAYAEGMSDNKNSELTRRIVIRFGSLALLSGLAVLQGCARDISANSKRALAGNQQLHSENSATPLQYDISAGFEKLNVIRRKYLLPAFDNEPRLQKAAQDYADLMGSRGLFGHEIGPGTNFKSRIFAVGYNNSSGENIGVNYSSIDKALTGWLNSPGHRKNMMKRNYTVAGLAYGFNTSGKNPRYTHFWVLIMGRDDGRYS